MPTLENLCVHKSVSLRDSASCLLLQAARGGPAVYPGPQAPKSAAKGAGGCTVLYRTGRLGYWGTGILGDWGTGTGTSTRTKTGTGTGCFFLTEAPQNLLSTNPFTISGTSKPFNMGSCTWKNLGGLQSKKTGT